MFSLDDETLEAGGKSILESRGDLGKLLFTASAGLAHASDTLSALEAEADGLYRKQAHGTELALLKKRLAELKSRKDAIDTLGFDLSRPLRPNVSTRRKNTTAASVNGRCWRRGSTPLPAIVRASPILADIRRKTARLAELPDIASPPRTWTGSVAEMIDDDASLRTRLSANVDEVERLTAKIASVEVDDVDPCDVRAGSRAGG